MFACKSARIPTICVVGLIALATASGQDTHCPVYPSSVRIAAERAINLDRQFARRPHSQHIGLAAVVPPSRNVVDEWIFRKMSDDGVDAAPLTTDAEFVRRIYLDLIGRVPTFEQAQAFLADTSATKRDNLIDTLLASPAYADQFSHWFLTRFLVTRTGLIGIPERNNFYNFVRQFVEQDRTYDAFVRDLITATGDSDTSPATALLTRQITDPFTSAQQE